jgi:hypothetical protein
MLIRLFELQHDLQTNYFNVNFQRMLPADRIRYIKDMKLSVSAELQEALDETDWKPWQPGNHVNRDAYLGELVDALHCLMNLFLALGDDPVKLADEVFERYTIKNHINRTRQSTGVAEKCGGCRRALDDPAVACTRRGDRGYCSRDDIYVNYVNSNVAA